MPDVQSSNQNEDSSFSQEKSRLPFALLTGLALLLTGKGDLGGFGIFTTVRNKSTQHKSLIAVAQENK